VPDVNEIICMDFSGAPPLLLPRSLLPFWKGHFLPAEPDGTDEYVDLELPDGRRFTYHALDEANPRTDYDRLCSQILRLPTFCIRVNVGPGEGLVISDERDGSVGWWPARQTFLDGCVRPNLDEGEFDHLAWEQELIWTVPERQIVLMNSCMHGQDPLLAQIGSDDHLKIELEPGDYAVSSVEYTGHGYWQRLYRFRSL
jgi:hypothetical protein